MPPRSPGRFSFTFRLEELESRFTPDITPGLGSPGGQIFTIVVPDWNGLYQIYGPTNINAFADAVDTTPGATLDFSTAAIVTPPTRGQATIDPTTGVIQYTPNYLLPFGLPKGQSPGQVLPESFSYRISDNLGGASNVATATFNGGVAPGSGGKLIAHLAGAVTNTLQPVSIDLHNYLETFDDVQVDYTSFVIDSSPTHGALSYNPSAGVITYTPDFGYNGFDNFGYNVSDTTGMWHSHAENFVLINTTAAPRLQTDPLGGQMLVIDGTPNDDVISVNTGPRPNEVTVSVNGVTSGPFRPTGRIVALGYGGNDRIQVSGTPRVSSWLVGGTGNDTLITGGGPSVLLGGGGNDTLTSGRERDLMIGGTGTDTLIGTGNDILVPGTTSFDLNQPALNAITREWTSGHTYSQQLLNLTGQITRGASARLNGSAYLTNATVLDDHQSDLLYAGGFESLIFPTASVALPNEADVVLDSDPGPSPSPFRHCNKWSDVLSRIFPPRGCRGGLLLAPAFATHDGYGDRISHEHR